MAETPRYPSLSGRRARGSVAPAKSKARALVRRRVLDALVYVLLTAGPAMGLLHWHNSYEGLIFPFVVSVFSTFLLRQFFMTIPADLEDAARIDGASHFAIYSRIVVPLAKPALATLIIFAFLGSWNNFLWPLV